MKIWDLFPFHWTVGHCWIFQWALCTMLRLNTDEFPKPSSSCFSMFPFHFLMVPWDSIHDVLSCLCHLLRTLWNCLTLCFSDITSLFPKEESPTCFDYLSFTVFKLLGLELFQLCLFFLYFLFMSALFNSLTLFHL